MDVLDVLLIEYIGIFILALAYAVVTLSSK